MMEKIKNFRVWLYFIPIIVSLPSVIIGGIAMDVNNIPGIYIILNAACLIIGWIVSCFALSIKVKADKRGTYITMIMSLILVLYALTFIDSGVDSVHRWLSLGPISLYISSIFAPILIIGLWSLLEKNKYLLAGANTVIVAAILFLQPDASQLTAFAIPMMIIFFIKSNKKIPTCFIIGILILFVIISWINLDILPPVIYVEDIVGMVMDMGIIWSVLGIAALILPPIPFFILPTSKYRVVSACLGLYYAIFIVSTFFGNFPVPLMGYGISPIIGYLIAITWLLKTGETGVKAN